MSCASRTKSLSWSIVSLSPVSHSDTRGRSVAQLALQRAKGAHIADDAGEHVAAAHQLEGLGLGGVERHAQFVEAAVDQLPPLALGQQACRWC